MSYLKLKQVREMQDKIDITKETIHNFAKLAILMKLEENMAENVKYKITEEDLNELVYDFISGDFWDIIDNRAEKQITRFKVKVV